MNFKTLIILLLLVVSCNQENKYSATKICNNFRFHAHTLYPDEIILIKFNNQVLLNTTIKNSQQGYYFDRDFCLPNLKDCTISISSFLKSKKYIDTTFIIKDLLHSGYHLSISMPHPINWRKYYKNGFPPKAWGYLSIDSCIRFVKLTPDSVYKNTLEL